MLSFSPKRSKKSKEISKELDISNNDLWLINQPNNKGIIILNLNYYYFILIFIYYYY
jgi:hypothetical protein